MLRVASLRSLTPFVFAGVLAPLAVACAASSDATQKNPGLPTADDALHPSVETGRKVLDAVPHWATADALLGQAPAGEDQPVSLSVYLPMRDQAAAEAELAAINDPGSPTYGKYLSNEQYAAKYAPTTDDVATLRAWLESEGFTVDLIPENRAHISVHGSVEHVERAFATKMGLFALPAGRGGAVRGVMTTPSVPAKIAHLVSAVHGWNEATAARPRLAGLPGLDRDTPMKVRRRQAFSPAVRGLATDPAPPPSGFRTSTTCSAFAGEKLDTTDPAYGGNFAAQIPYGPCGYTPPALRAVYGVDATIARGIDGTGVTVAIMDAYPASPTMLADMKKYAQLNDPMHPVADAQLKTMVGPGTPPPTVDHTDEAGWYTEQTLDVEAVHATAPGATVLFMGTPDNRDQMFTDALNAIVSGKLATIVSNSWDGLEGGPASEVTTYQNLATQAGLKGIGFYFSSGDDGDESTSAFVPTLDFPASLPGFTAVGGTSLGVTKDHTRAFELGWATGASKLDTTVTPNAWNPAAPGGFSSGAGGGTSRVFAQPTYQAGVVPNSVAKANSTSAMRASPDLAMLADPSTGMLMGLTQTFPEGVSYDQFRIGGTSLACPLMAGMMAVAEQFNGHPVGTANPKLYRAARTAAFTDIVPLPRGATEQAVVRVDFTNGVDASMGLQRAVVTISQSLESISVAKGWDAVTGLGVPNGEAFFTALR
jgi:subtilase family serine protease